MVWHKYMHLGRINQLKNEGRELLGEVVFWTEKRDGSNISFWIDEEGSFRMSSRNMEDADDTLINGVSSLPEYEKLFELVGSEENKVFYAEYVQAGRGPTRIERTKKHASLILFDVYDTSIEEYISYNWLYQMAYHHKIPIVKLYGCLPIHSMGELKDVRDALLSWCKKHSREGVVGKCYSKQVFFKEKIDLPKVRASRAVSSEIRLPEMPQDKIDSALGQARAEVERNGGNFKNPKDTMPVVAAHLNAQAREHCYSISANYFKLYQDYLEAVSK